MLTNQQIFDSIENILVSRDSYNTLQRDRVADLFRLLERRSPETPATVQPDSASDVALRRFLLSGPDATRLVGRITEDSLRAVTYEPQSAITGNIGGYLCPQEFVNSILLAMKAHDGLLDLCTRITTSGGQPAPFPICDDVGSASIVTESSPTTDGAFTFGWINFGIAPQWRSGLDVVPLELLEDSALDYENAVLRPALARRFARGLSGTFTSTLLSEAAAGVTTASSTAITPGEIFDLVDSVDPDYAGTFLMRRSTLTALHKLESTGGNYVFEPEVVNGRNYLAGYAVHLSSSMGGLTATEKPISFGDHSRFIFRNAGGMRLLTFREQYIEKGCLGYEAFWRADGHLGTSTNGVPVKYLQMKA